jgi:peroxiredoxin
MLVVPACDRADPSHPEPASAAQSEDGDDSGSGGASEAAAADGVSEDPVDTASGDGASTDAAVSNASGTGGGATATADSSTTETAAPSPGSGAADGPGPLPKPLFTKNADKCGGAAGVGQKVKGFKLPSTTGKTISPSYYRGRVMLLNFWGTWCKPCLKELPQFSRLYRRYRKYGLTLVAVATDEDRAAVADIISEKKISAKVAYAGETVAGAYGDRNFPFTFVVGADGTIRAAYDGYEEGCLGALEHEIRRALEQRNG